MTLRSLVRSSSLSPHEITAEQRLDLVRGFVAREFVARGMIADIAMHRPDRRGDRRNHHAHVMLTLRPIAGDAFGAKAREWNDTAVLEQWRGAWAEAVNTALARHGHAANVDHRSLVDRGLALEPEPKMGPVATAMERRGRRSHAGDDRRAAQVRNRKRIEAADKLHRINAELMALEEPAQVELAVAVAVPDEAMPVLGSSVIPQQEEIPPPPRRGRRRYAAAWTSYLYKMWATVARAITTPFRTAAFAVTRRKGPDLRH